MLIREGNGMKTQNVFANNIVNMPEGTGRNILNTAENVTENGREKNDKNILKLYGSGRDNITRNTRTRLMPEGESIERSIAMRLMPSEGSSRR